MLDALLLSLYLIAWLAEQRLFLPSSRSRAVRHFIFFFWATLVLESDRLRGFIAIAPRFREPTVKMASLLPDGDRDGDETETGRKEKARCQWKIRNVADEFNMYNDRSPAHLIGGVYCNIDTIEEPQQELATRTASANDG